MVGSSAIPPIPEIGHEEGYYARKVREAEKQGNDHAREAYKVAQYVTLATSPHLEWDQKIRYFAHALILQKLTAPLTVIASEAKQSTAETNVTMDCFVASLLAMTVHD